PYIFKTGNQETLTVMQYLFQHAFQNNNIGYGAAIAILLFIKILIISIGLSIINKYFKARYQ
ncbi:MAG: hypothetical protein ACRCR9_04130, partial [Chitinophagaceae bacterium]